MASLTRREFLYLASALPLLSVPSVWADERQRLRGMRVWHKTVGVLERAFSAEMTAHEHYVGYTRKALEEELVNMAQFFHAFSVSEKVHAENYQRILKRLGAEVLRGASFVEVADSRANLRRAAEKELEKIESLYPDFLRELIKYRGFLAGTVVKRIERLAVEFHICMICGSTIDREPVSLCDICNRPATNYRKIEIPS